MTKIISQIKKEIYKYSVAILGSRDQLCVNPILSDCFGKEKVKRCQIQVQNSECKFYKTYEEKRQDITRLYQPKMMDIEEWISEAKQEKFCSYYANRNLVHNAHLVVLPFETLIDPKNIEMISPYISNSVIIIEDADLFEGYVLEVKD